MNRPRITVVVTAYNRRDFVLDALRSVAAQTLHPDQFEIVLLTNVPRRELAPILEPMRVSWVDVPPGNWGEWMRSALSRFHGELLCFLDDDDLFDPAKLTSLLTTFERNPRVGYYHNRVLRFVDAPDPSSGRPGPAREGPLGPACGLVTDREKSRTIVNRLFWNAGGFNASAMAVRREVLGSLGPLLTELELGHPLALFYAAALGSWDLYFDPAPLTRYRIHSGNRSAPAGSNLRSEWRRMLEDGPAVYRDAERIARFIESDPRHRFSSAPVRSVGMRARLLRELGAPATKRAELLRSLGGYLALTPLPLMWDHRGMLGLAAAGSFSPRLPRFWLEH